MEYKSTSVTPSGPHFSSSSQPGQSNFRRLIRTEDNSPYPIPGLAADILHMRVKEGSKIRNILQFATARMQKEGGGSDGTSPRQVVFTGSGRGVTKTITCVEILKRKVGGLHQVSKLYYRRVNEVWENPEQGAPGITVEKTVPAICILLSKDPLDPQEPGYQSPQTCSFSTKDRERCSVLLKVAGSPSSKHTAKRLCLDSWTASPPWTSNIIWSRDFMLFIYLFILQIHIISWSLT